MPTDFRIDQPFEQQFLDHLDRIQRDANVERRALSAREAATGTVRTGGTPPRVQGLQLVQGTASLTFKWNAVPIQDLRRYEIEIATDAAFTGTDVIRVNTQETAYAFVEGVAGTTYFTRVRAVNTQETIGSYSPILNLATGQVGAAAIEDNSIGDDQVGTLGSSSLGASSVGTTQLADGSVTTVKLAASAVTRGESFNNSGSVAVSGTEITVATLAAFTTTGESVEVGLTIQGEADAAAGDQFTIRIKRNGVEIYSVVAEFAAANFPFPLTVAGLVHTPAAGASTYTATVQRTSGATTTLTVSRRIMSAREFRR